MSVTKRIAGARGGHWYRLDGMKVDGVTTVLGNGIPKPALTYWAAREVASFAASHLDLLGELDEAERVDLLKGAPWRDRDKAARRGTEVHGLAERLVAGDEIEVPDELVGHVDAYVRFLDEWQVRPILVEAVVGHRSHSWMGTLDLIADLADGQRWLLDIKTTRSGIYGETALQLAAYRHAEFYLDADLNEQPMPTVDAVAGIWVRADGYDLVPLAADDTAYRMFRHAQQVALFTQRLGKEMVGDVLNPPKKDAAA